MRMLLVVTGVMGVVGAGRAHAEPESLPPPTPLVCKAKTDCPSNATCSSDGLCVEESTAPTQTPPAPPIPAVDVVVLKSGERVEGHVREQARGQYVVIESKGAVRTLVWDTIAEVQVTRETEDRLNRIPSEKPQAAAKEIPITGKALKIGKKASGKKKKLVRVSTTTGLTATKEGVGLQRVRTCSRGGDPTCKEQMGLTVGSDGPKATYSSEVDCSKTPGLDVCKNSKQIGVSAAGFGASMTHEEVIAVDDNKRPSGSVNFSITGLVGFGTFTSGDAPSSQVLVSNLDANLKFLFGGKFPGKSGGGWVGFAVEPTLGFLGMGISSDDGFGGTSTIGATGIRGGSSAGLQLMRFGKMDPKSLKQRGVGVFLGAFAGYQQITIHLPDGSTFDQGDSSFGPELKLVFPNYNAGTAKYKSASINFMVLPTGDFLFISIGGAVTF